MSHQFASQDCSERDIWRAKRIQVRLLRTEKGKGSGNCRNKQTSLSSWETRYWALSWNDIVCSGDKNELLDTARGTVFILLRLWAGKKSRCEGEGEVLVVWWDDGGDDYDDSGCGPPTGLTVLSLSGTGGGLVGCVCWLHWWLGRGRGVVSPGDSELRQLSLPHSLDEINLR